MRPYPGGRTGIRSQDQGSCRIVLIGDPRQFSTVGRGGMFAHFVDVYGAVELDQVHRFRNHWERTASLRLRDGDPDVLVEYERHGRLHDGTLEEMETDIIEAWQQARLRGEAVATMANSVDTVDRLNRLAQHTRIAMGDLDPTASRLRAGDEQMLVGDEVVTRRNDRSLQTDQGLMVKNRDHWTITNIYPDRSVSLSGPTGAVWLSGRVHR
ncbi:MAG: AAA family ATPase [Thermoanaerobaculales bacterium]